MKKSKFSTRLLTMLLAMLMVVSIMPMSAFAAPASDLPANMIDHSILRALEYTGYNVQQQKNDGTLYQSGSYGSRTPASILSDISYGTSPSGQETVADSSTPTGKAPNIALFEQNGLCCAAFVSYYVMNYLPNIEGADTQFISDAIHATGMNSQAVVTWQTALNKLANEGKIEKIGTSASNVDRSKLTPGDLIIFGTSSNSHTHIAVYSGTYNGVDFIIHVGNDRGPEISRVDWMGQAGDKSSYPNAYFHLPQEVFESDGDIEVYKKDTDGNKLAGAVFIATNTETGKSYKIGPTNSNGYAKTENPVPYGTYTVKETVFPTNFHAYGQTEWTVTVDANNDGLVTINAVNEADPGSAKIVKTSEDGVVEGITFTITGNGINQTVTTDVNGEVKIDNLKPGTYQVKETMEDKYEPQETRSVVVVSNQVATVTFNNVLKRGDLQVIKTSEDNLVEGVKFHLYGTSLSGLKVDEYAVTDKNGVATFHDVLISGHESYTLEEMDTAERYIVPESQRTAIEWNVVTEKSFYNELKRGDLIVKKTSEDGFIEGMRFHLFGTSLSGIAVDEYASTDSDGIAYFNDILIGTGYTIEEVNTPTEPLFLGKFELREEKAPYGMVLLEEPIQVELVYAGQEVKITTTAASAVNERQKVVISLLKKLETDDHYGIGLGSEYENIKFGLYAAEAMTAADGTEIPKDGLLEIVGIDANGTAVFTADIPAGAKLYVKEYATDSHYLLSDTAFPVEFIYEDSSVATVQIIVNNGEIIDNVIIRGDIKGLKVDEENNLVASAVFGLFRADETEFTIDTALATATSGEDGVFTFEDIPYGNWVIKELSCPEHLVLSDELIEVTISEQDQLVELKVVNEIIYG